MKFLFIWLLGDISNLSGPCPYRFFSFTRLV